MTIDDVIDALYTRQGMWHLQVRKHPRLICNTHVRAGKDYFRLELHFKVREGGCSKSTIWLRAETSDTRLCVQPGKDAIRLDTAVDYVYQQLRKHHQQRALSMLNIAEFSFDH